MIYSDMSKAALNFAYEIHSNQKDKGGYAYIAHPIHLAEQMLDEDSVVVALLHDCLEDGKKDVLSNMEKLFPEHIVEAVKRLTRNQYINVKNDADYMKYIEDISKNSLARKVKIADLNHNLCISRMQDISSNDSKRFEKYRNALDLLLVVDKFE